MVRQVIGRPLKPLVILVSYFSTAEISQIANAMKDFALTPYNRALDAEAQLQSDPETVDYDMGLSGKKILGEHEDELILRISDLGGFFRGGLDKVGEAIGLKKLTLDKIERGMNESDWKDNMGELLARHKAKFEEYALRDAEIAVEAYNRLRQFFLQEKYGLDIVNFKTASSLSAYLFRTRYLPETFRAAPITKLGGEYYQHNPDAVEEDKKWKKHTRYYKVLRYDWHQVRYYAMLSYWGGRAEAYGRGLTNENEDLVLYDVDSLYPSSACLQPLPNSETEWVSYDSLRSAEGLDGYACVSFDFSKSEKEVFYPCIPVMGFKTGKLYFPLSGTAWCTLAEVEEAVRLGGKSCIKSIYGVGFEPGYKERRHSLRKYMQDFMKLKRDPKIKDTYEYELYKLLLNGPIGKFWETEKDFLTKRVLTKYRENVTKWSVEKDVPELYNDWSRIRQRIRKRVGSAWWPEAASLILGKARALMSQFINKKALMAITDSVLLPKTTGLDCRALKELSSVGSGLKEPGEVKGGVSRAWILRTKVYALWNNKQEITKVARHAWDIEEEDFTNWIQASIANGRAEPIPEWAKHPVRIGQVVRTGRAEDFGKWFPRSHRNPPSLVWDEKRDSNDVNGTDLFKPGSFHALPPLLEVKEKVQKPGWPKGKSRRPKAESFSPEAFSYTHNNSQLFDDEPGRVSVK